MATKADSNPRMIMKKAQEHLIIDAASQMTRHKNLRQLIHRKRNLQEEDNNPLTRSQMYAPKRETIVIPLEFQKFVLADSGFDDKLRIICFGNLYNLKQLAENKDWFGDGTFDVSPLVFKQMFTLNILKNGKTLPNHFQWSTHYHQTNRSKLILECLKC